MPRAFRNSLLLAVLFCLFSAPALGGTDEYQGDTTIYSGLPAKKSRPNVLILVDNSRATLNEAPGQAYDPAGSYPPVANCGEQGYPRCYEEAAVYLIDNQGDVANQTVLEDYALTKNCTNNDYVIFKTLDLRGTYSGSGSADYPNIGSGGSCDDDAPKGAVYVLGKYLNYTLTTVSAPTPPPGVPAICTTATVPMVKVLSRTRECTRWAGNNCKQWTDVDWETFYKLLQTNTGVMPPAAAYWESLGKFTAGSMYPGTPVWSVVTPYTMPRDIEVAGGTCTTCGECIDEAGGYTPPTDKVLTQREIIYTALEQAVGSAIGAVNVGAMVYGLNNSGGLLVYEMTDLSQGAVDVVAAPDCTLQTNASQPFCQFLAALPGLRKDPDDPGPFTSCSDFNGADCVSSNTGRPQAEAVFDAGYYFGASYTPVTNNTRMTRSDDDCRYDHIILLTNGFTNGDGSPNLGVVGDADLDGYPDETVYGLGSHWLDDVAKHLNMNYGVTTHAVLAFQERDALIENAALDGKGKFFQAYNAQELSAALLKLLASIINEANTSFVAPVVPASTTNRTVSSNKVYLGLFRPQLNAPWHGNVKKYSIGGTNQLLGFDVAGNVMAATDNYGEFDRDSISYWSLKSGESTIPSVGVDIDPSGTDVNKPRGDGGQVDAGGAGGRLVRRMDLLAAAIRSNNTWQPSGFPWRNIYTVLFPELPSKVDAANLALTAAQNLFVPWNEFIMPESFGVPDRVATDTEKENLIRFVHGFTDNDLGQTTQAYAREWVLGDVLHSRPLVFNYSRYTEAEENLCAPAETGGRYNSTVIYVGANDGMLHAFRDCDGEELWAFLPPDAIPSLPYLMESKSVGGHPTYVDAAPSAFVHDLDGDGFIESATDRVVLVFGLHRGGSSNDPTTGARGAYYALDVTNPAQPVGMWRIATDNAGEMGQTWSQPRIAKLPVDTDNFKVVAFVGGGYDNNEDTRYGNTQTFLCENATSAEFCDDTNQAPVGGTVDGSGDPQTSSGSLTSDKLPNPKGRGIYAIEVAHMKRDNSAEPFEPVFDDAGKIYWSYVYNATDDDRKNLLFSIPGDLNVLDTDGNGYIDRIYGGDTGGNLWRFDLSDADMLNWKGDIIFRSNVGSDSSNGRKIFYRSVIVNVGGAPHIYFGTGDREHPLNRAVNDRMYCVIDWGQGTGDSIDELKLEDVTSNALQDPDATASETEAIMKRLYSRPDMPYDSDGNFRYGWYIKLDGTDRTLGGERGEKVLAPATVFNGQVFFSTYQLKFGGMAGCEAGNLGISRLYHLDYKTGEAIYNYDLTNDLNSTDVPPVNERTAGGEAGELLLRSDRVRTLGEGIPSGIVTLLDASGKVTLLISSSDKVEASGLPDVKLITPVYWMQW